jgi:Tol biopolymer transport system component
VSVTADGRWAESVGRASISGDGTVVAFGASGRGLVNGGRADTSYVYVKDLATGKLRRLTTGKTMSGEPSLSGDGSRVAYLQWPDGASPYGKPVEVYVTDLGSGAAIRASRTIGGGPVKKECYQPVLSGDGRTVLFTSYADNLIRPDAAHSMDLFVRRLPKVI